MPGRDNGAVVLVIECSAAEIYHPHCCVLYSTLVSLLRRERKRSYIIFNCFDLLMKKLMLIS